MSRVVVLLGPPGSGKSTLAAALAAQLGWRWRDREADLVDRYGGRDAFLAVKDDALRVLHDGIRAEADDDGPPVVVETTGLSEASVRRRACGRRARSSCAST